MSVQTFWSHNWSQLLGNTVWALIPHLPNVTGQESVLEHQRLDTVRLPFCNPLSSITALKFPYAQRGIWKTRWSPFKTQTLWWKIFFLITKWKQPTKEAKEKKTTHNRLLCQHALISPGREFLCTSLFTLYKQFGPHLSLLQLFRGCTNYTRD